jgi:hypothetical protein
MSPAQVVREWVSRFNQADREGLAALYAPDAINHQVVIDPLVGRDVILRMCVAEFGRARMTCIVEHMLEDGEWAALEWRDPNGLRGCGFLQVQGGQIVCERGYVDQLSFSRLQGLAVPETYLE